MKKTRFLDLRLLDLSLLLALIGIVLTVGCEWNSLWASWRRNQAASVLSSYLVGPRDDWFAQAAAGSALLGEFADVREDQRISPQLRTAFQYVDRLSDSTVLSRALRKRNLETQGDHFFQQRQWSAAAQAWERALSLEPLDPALIYKIWQAYTWTGDSLAAAAQVRRLRELPLRFHPQVDVSPRWRLVGLDLAGAHAAFDYGFPFDVLLAWEADLWCEQPICVRQENGAALYGVGNRWYQRLTVRNVLENGAFEEIRPGFFLLEGWLPDTIHSPEDLPPDFAIERAQEEGMTGRWLVRLTIVNRDRAKLSTNFFRLESDKLYIIAGLVKSEPPEQGNLYWALYRAPGQPISSNDQWYGPVAPSHEPGWRAVSGVFARPGQAEGGCVWLLTLGGPGVTAWFDDVMVFPIDVPILLTEMRTRR